MEALKHPCVLCGDPILDFQRAYHEGCARFYLCRSCPETSAVPGRRSRTRAAAGRVRERRGRSREPYRQDRTRGDKRAVGGQPHHEPLGPGLNHPPTAVEHKRVAAVGVPVPDGAGATGAPRSTGNRVSKRGGRLGNRVVRDRGRVGPPGRAGRARASGALARRRRPCPTTTSRRRTT